MLISYVGVVPEGIQHRLVQGGSKALEHIVVDVVGVASKLAQSLIEDGEAATALELDNVLLGDDLGVTGDNEGRGLRALPGGRGGQGHGQDGEEQRWTHLEERVLELWRWEARVDRGEKTMRLSGCCLGWRLEMRAWESGREVSCIYHFPYLGELTGSIVYNDAGEYLVEHSNHHGLHLPKPAAIWPRVTQWLPHLANQGQRWRRVRATPQDDGPPRGLSARRSSQLLFLY